MFHPLHFLKVFVLNCLCVSVWVLVFFFSRGIPVRVAQTVWAHAQVHSEVAALWVGCGPVRPSCGASLWRPCSADGRTCTAVTLTAADCVVSVCSSRPAGQSLSRVTGLGVHLCACLHACTCMRACIGARAHVPIFTSPLGKLPCLRRPTHETVTAWTHPFESNTLFFFVVFFVSCRLSSYGITRVCIIC